MGVLATVSDKGVYVATDSTAIVARVREYADAGVEFTGATFRQLCGPGVYVWLRGDQALYVGRSRTLIRRASQPTHHRLAVQQSDTLPRP